MGGVQIDKNMMSKRCKIEAVVYNEAIHQPKFKIRAVKEINL